MSPFTTSECGVDPPTRSRKPSVADATTPLAAEHAGPTAFFLKSEEEMMRDEEQEEQKEEGSVLESTLGPTESLTGPQSTSNFGVQSLAETIESVASSGVAEAVVDTDELLPRLTSTESAFSSPARGSSATDLPLRGPTTAFEPPSASKTYSPGFVTRHLRRLSHSSLSRPLTPLTLSAYQSASQSVAPSTPKSISLQSLRLSDTDDDAGSQTMASGGEDWDEGMHMGQRQRLWDDGPEGETSVPELVMPSLRLPSRRPFTETGRRMGKLKVMVVGGKGAGKSSLIRSMVQLCEDIVHTDAVPLHPSGWSEGKRRRSGAESGRIVEIAASSRPLPAWWAELEEESEAARRRRRSVTDVLERNITFVDTPALDLEKGPAAEEELVQYVEGHLFKSISTATMTDSELLQVLCGNGSQVDLVLFLFSHGEEVGKEIQFLERLAPLTNVIPLIGRCDMLSDERLSMQKEQLSQTLLRSSAHPLFLDRPLSLQEPDPNPYTARPTDFSKSPSPAEREHAVADDSFHWTTSPTAPFAVSSVPGPDDEVDASLLMASTYLPPLHPSDLHPLVRWLFHPDTISYLRASAARKAVHWRRRAGLRISPATASRASPLLARSATSPSSLSSSLATVTSLSAGSAAVRAHASREERLAQLRLAKWATELRAAVAAERERYERRTAEERAAWLARQVERAVAAGELTIECGEAAGSGVVVGQVRQGEREVLLVRPVGADVGGTEAREEKSGRRERRRKGGKEGAPRWSRRRRGGGERWGAMEERPWMGGVAWQTVRLLSGVGIVGAVLIAVVRTWGRQGETVHWGWS